MRTALVTGGGSGIGRATAVRLVRDGYRVAVAGRRREPLDETAALAGGGTVAVTGDVSVEADADRLVAEAVAALGRLDVVVNNAGGIRRNVPVHELEADRFDEQVATNLRSVFLVSRAALRHMLATDGDRAIVNVASTLAHTLAPGIAPYAAAKAGVLALTRAIAVEYGVHGIRCNAVCPGVVRTPLAYVDRPGFEERQAEFARMYPLGRLGEPEDVAAAIAALAAPDAAWTTGAVLDVDGGLTIQ